MSKIDWQFILNPWAVVRKLRRDLAYVEQEAESLYDQLRDAEKVAFLKAEEHFRLRAAHLEASHDKLLKSMVTLKAMEPLSFVIPTNRSGSGEG